MNITFGITPWLLIPAVLLAVFFTYWTYLRSRPLLPMGKRLPLMVLRFFTLTILLTLLFEPVLRMIQKLPQTPVLAVLVDNSKSAGLRIEEMKRALGGLKWDGLDAKIKPYSFDASPKPASDATFNGLKYDGDRTDIAKALGRIREDLGDDLLGGVVLLSDGQYNTGRNPLFVAERFPVPIHTLAVGDTTRQRDVQIRRVVANEYAYLNTLVPIQVGVRANGYDGQTATVTVSDGGKVLVSGTVTLQPNQEVTANLNFQPIQTGLRRLTASVTRFDGELTHQNNVSVTTVQVLDSKMRVLLIGGVANPDLSALQQTLLSDPNLEVTQLVQKAPGQWYSGSMPDQLTGYDALILHGYPGPGALVTDVQRVAAAANAGKPLFFFMGQQTNLNMLRDVLGDVLPAKPSVVRNSFVEAGFAPSGAGSLHPVLEIEEPKSDQWNQLPPLLFNQSRWQLAPEARVLAYPQIGGTTLPDPLLVVRSRGKIRSAALLGAGLFRWRSLPQDLDFLKNFLPSLTNNTLRWTSSRQDDRPIRVRATRSLYGGGESVQFTGQVYDESLNPVDRALVQVSVTGPDGREIPVTLNGLGGGRYFADIGTLPEGSYTFSAEAKLGEQTLGTDAGSFAVSALSLEYQETTANASLMRAMAQRSGGLFMPANDAGRFVDELLKSGKLKPVYAERNTEIEPWTLGWLLALLVSLLTVEWFLRKRNGLL